MVRVLAYAFLVFFLLFMLYRLYLLLLKVKYYTMLNEARGKVSLPVYSKKLLIPRTVKFSISACILVIYFVFSPNIFAFSTSLTYQSDCPTNYSSIEDVLEVSTHVMIVKIDSEIEKKPFNPFIADHTPTDKYFYSFNLIENLGSQSVESNVILYNRTVNDLSNFTAVGTCAVPLGDIRVGETYIIFGKYRDPYLSIQNTDPRIRDGHDYVPLHILKLEDYNHQLDYLSQDDEIDSVIQNYIDLVSKNEE